MSDTREPGTGPCIITVAITGSVPRKEDNPAVPITVAEQIESTQEAFEAGATIVHVHVRDEQQRASSDPEKFAAFQEGVHRHCPGMIVQFSTGGRGRAADQRGAMLHHCPDMASLATGSVNFPNMIYENPPELIDTLASDMLRYGIKPEVEIFDLAMLYAAADMATSGQLKTPLHVQFVFGLKNALPPRRAILEFEVAQLKALLPDATWTAAGIGRSQLDLNLWALEMGGHCRTGLEDNIRFDKARLAASNAELVARVAALCGYYGRHPASVAEAREILKLPAAA
ncbi:3-keto-5-aminohexanoate cleavage protein [Pelagibius litoralis]|uniref:3-keto-5-aminohexanoate cleavage protein n=1 Tax=Pelagibius litoralis TaxID=374515 RepID=A0A967KG17_9PROT|nr:3-keto-5-aminohexanoate cleavage protein [Pelagibius litoralis]NIA69991.1 3-keto-5-aminohexanoate cleavage protein [Pelagibius litoralis]